MNIYTDCGIYIQWNSAKTKEMIHTYMWMNLQNIMLLGRDETQRSHIAGFYLYEIYWKLYFFKKQLSLPLT